MKCRICESISEIFGQGLVLKKFNVKFYKCNNCDFIQTEEPYWLSEAYSTTITKSDIGLIGRNIYFSDITRNFILTCSNPKSKYIDYGGGFGMFVRLMRDKGFDFYRYDPICENLFAGTFDAQQGEKYAILTAWEVLEHLQNPLEDFRKMLEFSGCIFCSTLVLPHNPKSINDWWYYGLEHGQHISFYSNKTLLFIANIFNLSLVYTNGNIHLFADNSINPFLVRLSLNKRYGFIRKFFEKPQPQSLLEKDFYEISGKKLIC